MKATIADHQRQQPLANNQLSLVVGQVRFPPIPRFSENGYTLPFEDAMREQFPKASREPQINVVITDNEVKTVHGAELLRFADLHDHYTVVLAADFIALECRSYDTFEEFNARFLLIVDLAGKYFEIKYRLRIGIRYINELRWEKATTYAKWQEFLNPDFMGWDAIAKLGGTMQQTIAEFATKRDDGGTFRLRRGFLTGTTIPPVKNFRLPIPPEFYLIDLDYSSEDPLPLNQGLPELTKLYHDFIETVFFEMTGNAELQQYLKGNPS